MDWAGMLKAKHTKLCMITTGFTQFLPLHLEPLKLDCNSASQYFMCIHKGADPTSLSNQEDICDFEPQATTPCRNQQLLLFHTVIGLSDTVYPLEINLSIQWSVTAGRP